MWGRKGSSPTAPAPAEQAPEPPKSPFKAFLTSPVLASMLIALVIAGSVAGVLAARHPSHNAATSESPATTTEATTTETTTTETTLPHGGQSPCGGGLSVGPNTSCAFAQNVEDAYHANGGPGTFQVYSPVTGHTYAMTCNLSRRQVVCTGGNNAAVYFPE